MSTDNNVLKSLIKNVEMSYRYLMFFFYVPIDFKDFQSEYPLQNESGLALFKMKCQAWCCAVKGFN